MYLLDQPYIITSLTHPRAQKDKGSGKRKEKSAKEASKTFHDIMKASVSGNPKPKKKDADKGKKAFEEGIGGDAEKSIEKDKTQ